MSARRARKIAHGLPIDIYARISLDAENDEEGAKRQVRQCLDRLKGMGLKVGKIHIDNDTSAFTGVKRPEYDKMLARLRNGESGGICAYHLKRLLRRMTEMEALIDVVEGTGARVITLMSSELDLNTASGRGIGRMLAAFGQMEVEELSERLSGYFADRAKQGKPHKRGVTPFGFQDDWVTHEPAEAKLIRELFDRVIHGWSLTAIARDWQERGVANRRGNAFSAAGLRSLIVSKRLVGLSVNHGEVVGPGDWKPIVSEEIQAAAIAALGTRRTHLRPTSAKRPPRLLSSMARCGGGCGRPMGITRSDNQLYYRCKTIGCGGVMVRADYAEQEVEARFLARLTEPKTHKALEKLRTAAPDTRDLLDRIERYKLDLKALAAKHGAEEITLDEWMIARKGIEARLAEAEQELETVTTNPVLLAASPEEIVSRWHHVDLDERRRRLAPYVERVSVQPTDGSGGRAFNPDRIHVDWRI